MKPSMPIQQAAHRVFVNLPRRPLLTRRLRHILGLSCFALLALGVFADPPPPRLAAFDALLFSKTEGFRHASIADGIAAVQAMAAEHGFSVATTEDAGAFTDANLAGYDVVLFLNTTGDVLNAEQQAAFERFIQAGGGFAGVHAAADTEYDWPWYGGLVGAYFASHPAIQSGTLLVADPAHPSTAMLPKRWTRTDEWYNFRSNPRSTVHVLATLDEATYDGGAMGYDHPIAWCHDYEGGRAWYTAGGHTAESYADPLYREHLLRGLVYAAGMAPGDCGASRSERFEKVVLEANTDDPMDLAVAPDGRVFFVERGGRLRLYKPDTGTTQTAGTLNVATAQEDGLLGIVLDPSFDETEWLYLFYSPAGNAPKQHVSRFTVTEDVLDLATEHVLLEIPVQRDECCHSAGSMAFDAAGNLYIATGDNTNPFASDGYAPLDERPGRAAWDAQRTSGNTNDLRGKILRITPQPDGTYTIPEGNLFAGDARHRPEIYTMGHRNPFRIAVDTETGWLYWGDVGPDAQAAAGGRGPAGLDEWNQAREAGNYGWPYCIGDNTPYLDYDFGAGTSDTAFDCDAPVNTSPNNTGATDLPPAKPAWIWYPYGPSQAFPILSGGGRTAMAGPTYHYDPTLDSDVKLPAYYDGTVFLFEWSRNWIHEVKLDDAGDLLAINPFVPAMALRRPMAMKMGPDGAIYLLEWGSDFGGGNSDAQLIRIEYTEGPSNPVAVPPDEESPERRTPPAVYPNPLQGPGTITFTLPAPQRVTLEVFDVLGRRVAVLLEAQPRASGVHQVPFATDAWPSGTYLCRLTTTAGSVDQPFAVLR